MGLLLLFVTYRRKRKAGFHKVAGSTDRNIRQIKGMKEEGTTSCVSDLDYDPSEDLDHHGPLPSIMATNGHKDNGVIQIGEYLTSFTYAQAV
jgi:hypothetical protein